MSLRSQFGHKRVKHRRKPGVARELTFSCYRRFALLNDNDPWLGRLMIRERPGVSVFRFWQEGSGYDRDIVEPKYLRTSIEYLHANPVRRGLCGRADQWHWSSWHYYHKHMLPIS